MAERDGVSFNSRTLPVYLGLLALATALYSGISAVNAYAFQIERIEGQQVQISEAVTELKTSVQGLDKSITSLTIVLNRLEDRYETIEGRVGILEQRKK